MCRDTWDQAHFVNASGPIAQCLQTGSAMGSSTKNSRRNYWVLTHIGAIPTGNSVSVFWINFPEMLFTPSTGKNFREIFYRISRQIRPIWQSNTGTSGASCIWIILLFLTPEILPSSTNEIHRIHGHPSAEAHIRSCTCNSAFWLSVSRFRASVSVYWHKPSPSKRWARVHAYVDDQ